jgi:hypothetical protein
MSGVIDRFPLLLPVRNPVAGYGASAVTRTRDRGHVAEVKNQFHRVAGSQSGFPKKPFSPLMSNRCLVSSIKMLKTVYQRCVMRMRVSPIDVRVRMGDAIGPFQLANGFEAVIGYECQERSNPLSLILTMHTSHARCDKASEWVGGEFPCPELFCELRGLCRHSYFGPRTCGRGITSRSRCRVSPSHPHNAGREGLPRNHLHGPQGDSGR